MRISPGYPLDWLCLVAEVTPQARTHMGYPNYADFYGSVGACDHAKARAAARAMQPSTRKVAPESFTRTPTVTAAQAPITPARTAGNGSSQPSIRRHWAIPAAMPNTTTQNSGFGVAWAKS